MGRISYEYGTSWERRMERKESRDGIDCWMNQLIFFEMVLIGSATSDRVSFQSSGHLPFHTYSNTYVCTYIHMPGKSHLEMIVKTVGWIFEGCLLVWPNWLILDTITLQQQAEPFSALHSTFTIPMRGASFQMVGAEIETSHWWAVYPYST